MTFIYDRAVLKTTMDANGRECYGEVIPEKGEDDMKKELLKEIEKLLEQASEKQVRMLARLIRAFFRV